MKNIDARFDLIFSSHCMEHSLDLVAHLNEVYDLLTDNGIYCLVLPDKRFTFDYFKQTSELTDVLCSHYEALPRHSLKSYLEVAYETHNDWLRHWQGDHGQLQLDNAVIQRQLSAYKAQSGRDPGLHTWVFTEESFFSLITEMQRLGIMRLSLHRLYNVVRDGNSFCAVLTK